MNFKDEISQIVESKRPVIVVGLGKSGMAAARFFQRLGVSVWGIEKKSRVSHDYPDFPAYFDNMLPPNYEQAALAVISPGVPLNSEVPQALSRADINLVGELELGIEYSGVPSIVVTGSNGKSTVVSLIHELLSYGDNRPYLCGNIGRPVVDLLQSDTLKPSVLVVEASSYQLEITKVLKPIIGIILNISENHLERHGSLDAYIEAKLSVCSRQNKKDYAVINFDDQILFSKRTVLPGTVAPFGKDKTILESYSTNAWIEYIPSLGKDAVYVTHNGETQRYDLTATHLVGEHTRYNWAAALLAATIKSAPSAHLHSCIKSFKGLEHRLEVVSHSDDRIVINDSKSTTVASTVAAVDSIRKAYPEHHISLLVGGKVKLGSWKPLAETIKLHAPYVSVSCFGGDGGFINETLKTLGVKAVLYPTMEAAAINILGSSAKSPEIVLLSPGCASFDEFTDFEARGNMFKSLVCRK